MGIIRFELNDEYREKLEQAAEKMQMSVQDYIRYKLFGIKTIFTVDEAVKRIQNSDFYDLEKYPNGFTLPDVYGAEWVIERGSAGIFGKRFNKYIENHPELGIVWIDKECKQRRRAHYVYNKN